MYYINYKENRMIPKDPSGPKVVYTLYYISKNNKNTSHFTNKEKQDH